MQGIGKSFGPVHVLEGVDLNIAGGEIHALMGENGAGKSTLMKILSGSYTADAGSIQIDGKPVAIRSSTEAEALGMPGEAAILAFGQVRDLPWVVSGELAVRKVTTLSLSFDHRIVDGELGSAVLRDVGSMLEDPIRILAWS